MTKMLEPESDANVSVVGEELRSLETLAIWHERRAEGQKRRFRRLEACGLRNVKPRCRACGDSAKATPEGCGITRLCDRCSLFKARKRVARFGRGRERAARMAERAGYLRKRRSKRTGRRVGALWRDRMITLTVPHFLLSDIDPTAKLMEAGPVRARDATMARIYALRAAVPIFSRKLRDHWKREFKAGRRTMLPDARGKFSPPPMHRAFEWTPGKDGLGHPHLHIWSLCPWLPRELVAEWWTAALRAVGVPMDRSAIVDVRVFEQFNRNAVGELIKGGPGSTRQALERARLYGPGGAFEYSDGWTIAEVWENARPEVIASLYAALEGMRLSQASAGFFVDDPAPKCKGCGAEGCFHVTFEIPTTPRDELEPRVSQTGPPS